MEPFPSTKKIYLIVIQEESNNIDQVYINQEQYSDLISLLQHSKLMPPTIPSSTITSLNQISPHPNLKPNESSDISYVSSLACSSYPKSNIWLLDSRANDHECSSLHFSIHITILNQLMYAYQLILNPQNHISLYFEYILML